MILSGMSETKQDVVQLDADRSLFGFILRHIYGEVIEVELSQLVPLLGMAASFSMSNLRDQLANILANHISIDNCCSILATADLLTCSNLKCVAENVLHRNFAAVSRTDTFLELDVDMVEHILRSDEITDCDESVVFESVVRWLHYYEDTRKEFKELMLSLIRFPLMDSGYLSDVIKMHPIMHRPDQSDLLLEAFEHHALRKFYIFTETI